jgi:glutamyl-tRNA synthetase
MQSTPKYITRLAPTPSGYLHTGNILNFLLVHDWSKQLGAEVLLRIDDLDSDRVQAKYVDYIFEVLEKLRIAWDLGPRNAMDLAAWSQHGRSHVYEALLQQLIATGRVYACDCSRAQLQSRGESMYQGHCRHRNIPLDAANVAWRLHVDNADVVFFEKANKRVIKNLFQQMGDPVIRRRDGIAAYHVASLADDLEFAVTHVVRGKDLLDATALQVYMAQLLGLSAFQEITFWHHPLLVNRDGEKLSKSAGEHLEKPSLENIEQIFENYKKWRAAFDA